MPYPYDKENNTCLDNALSGEPIFVLRSKDRLSIRTVRHWIVAAEAAGVSQEKIEDARRVVKAMQEWGHKYGVKIPD